MIICKKCKTTQTSKWYSNKTECRSCYRKSIYTPKEKKNTARQCTYCYTDIIDRTLGQNKKYCDKSCSEKSRYIPKKPIIKSCKKCNKEYKTIINYKKYCSKRCYDTNYKDRKGITFEEKIKHNLRNRLCMALKNNYKSGSAVKDLGCSIDEFKIYMESLFTEGMTWKNYGLKGWHIDHIKPLALFNLTNPKDFKEAVYYTNLQPLWAKDNLSKGAKYEK